MALVKFKIARGLRAKMRREGLSIVDKPGTYFYRVKKKNNPKIVENNQQFGANATNASDAYKALSDEERRQLKARMDREGIYKNVWHLFMKEFYGK